MTENIQPAWVQRD